MSKKDIYQYYVEGETEKKLLKVLKTELGCIEPGKIECFNAIQDICSPYRVRSLKVNTVVVLIFDTDVLVVNKLKKNIDFFMKHKSIKKVICIPQVKNLEDELVQCCNIAHIKELTKSKTDSDFKRDFLKMSNVGQRLNDCGFNVSALWKGDPGGVFKGIKNEADLIRGINR